VLRRKRSVRKASAGNAKALRIMKIKDIFIRWYYTVLSFYLQIVRISVDGSGIRMVECIYGNL
jgi:hypothetical protein